MKVALLSDCYLPRVGGIESQVSDLARQLLDAGHEVEVFTATPGEQGERRGVVETVDEVPVHRMSIALPADLPVNPFAPPEVRRRLRAGDFDVAHVHMGVVSPFAYDMARLTTGLGLPTAITWHCVLDRAAPIVRGSGMVRRWVRDGAVLSAVSSFAADGVRAATGGKVPVAVLPNGIDATAWAPVAAGAAADDGEPRPLRLVTASRLASRKRPGALVDVMSAVREQLPTGVEVTLDVLGDGPLRDRLQGRIDGAGLGETITLHGRVARDELARRYQESDIYLSTTRLEAFGIAVLEARTAGLPVVAYADSGVADIITDGLSGLLATDDEALAAAVVELAADDDLRTRIATHNATTPPAQAWPEVVEQALAEYRRAQQQAEATSGRRRGRR